METILAIAATALVGVTGSAMLGATTVAQVVNNDAAWNALPPNIQNAIRAVGWAGGR